MASEQEGDRRQREDEPEILSTPADRRSNGKRMWGETWSKTTAIVLSAILLGLLSGAWARAVSAAKATADLYELRPIVDRHEVEIRAMALKGEMTQDEADTLAAKLFAGMEKARAEQERKRKAGH